jgi:DNA-binding SARP family transcriptional activator
MKYRVRLLGRLSVHRDEEVLTGLEGRKVQELFAFLLLNRRRPHLREALAALLWPDVPPEQSRRYLRQTLWQLQTVLAPQPDVPGDHLLIADPEWVEINPAADLWLDVDIIERGYQRVQKLRGEQLDAKCVEGMLEAVELHDGELLSGCYVDWCFYERERLRQIILTLLDKLMTYSEARAEYDAGLFYGLQILRFDRASERTHRRMMRMHYLSGDRSAALQQYQRCVAVLSEELLVAPSKSTEELHRMIQADTLEQPPMAGLVLAGDAPPADATGLLNQLLTRLADLQHQVQEQSLQVGMIAQRLG